MFKKGYKQTEEHKRKISKALQGRKHTEEWKRKISERMTGKPSSVLGKHWKIKDTSKMKKSEETRKNISIATKKAMLNPEIREKIRLSHIGKKDTSETRKKKSESHKGGKAYNYKGIFSSVYQRERNWVEMKLWRESVFARDNWTCQKCLQRGGKLHSHHIINFAEVIELRTSINNGITFCKNCHNLFHKIYGKKNNNIEQIKVFIKGKLDR